MKINVDPNVCERYGHCCFEAPTVFELDADGELQYRADVDDVDADILNTVALACPVQAIAVSTD